MKKIVVYNNKIVINNYNYGDVQALDNSFEIYDKATYSYQTIAAIYDRKNKNVTIPRGIDISYIERLWFQSVRLKGLRREKEDERRRRCHDRQFDLLSLCFALELM